MYVMYLMKPGTGKAETRRLLLSRDAMRRPGIRLSLGALSTRPVGRNQFIHTETKLYRARVSVETVNYAWGRRVTTAPSPFLGESKIRRNENETACTGNTGIFTRKHRAR